MRKPSPRSGLAALVGSLAVVFLLPAIVTASDPPEKESAADLFERTLAALGLDAAIARLSEALADSSEPYSIDGYELGNAYLRCADAQEARKALTRARDLSENRADLVWMIERVDDLAANAKLQVETEDKLIPGGPTGLTGPYLSQAPPGRTPRVFAPGILSTTAHEYHLSFSPDGRAIIFCGRKDLQDERELYRAERTPDGWSTPTKLFPGMYATSTRDGTLYYTARGEGRDYGAIVKRRWTGDGYGDPETVAGEGINSEFPDAHP